MNDINTIIESNTKAAFAFAEISTSAFTEIMNNQVSLLNEVLGSSLSYARKLQSAKDLNSVVEQAKTFGTDFESKSRKAATANLKVIEDSGKKAYELLTKQASAAAPASSK